MGVLRAATVDQLRGAEPKVGGEPLWRRIGTQIRIDNCSCGRIKELSSDTRNE